MPVTLRLTNTGRDPLTVYLQGRPIAFDLTVRNLDGTIVWRRLEGAVVPAILAVRQLEPGASLEFEEVWRQVSNAGETVPPGDYRVTGALPTDARSRFKPRRCYSRSFRSAWPSRAADGVS